MSDEPTNWIDRLDHLVRWGERHPFLAKVLGGLVFTAMAVAALVWKVKTTGHE
jgi:hypothetical protein